MTDTRKLTIVTAAALAIALNSGPAAAGGDARSLAMGGARTAAARGLDAAEANPAFLAFSEGLTIGLAVAVIVFWSSSVGSLLPLFATLIGVDPALISGPLMSTLVDATGLFIYLSVAQAVLGI